MYENDAFKGRLFKFSVFLCQLEAESNLEQKGMQEALQEAIVQATQEAIL